MRLLHKEVWYDPANPIYRFPGTEAAFRSDFIVKRGRWYFENGKIVGRHPYETPGMIISRSHYYCDVMVDFKAQILSPSTHDVNVMWNGHWDLETNTRGVGYVAGINGWWRNMVGIEKSPEYKLNVATQLFTAEPDHEYHVCAGSVAGHCFVLIDGKEALELTDPDPIDVTQNGLIGFEAFASWIAISDVKVYKLKWKESDLTYPREF